jgi:hypothetical protein
VRNVFRLVDSFPVAYGVGLFTCLVTRDHVRVGDLAAGTLMIYENRHTLAARSLRLSARDRWVDIGAMELLGEILERWEGLEPSARVRLARSVIERVTGSAPETSASESGLREQLERLARPSGQQGDAS